MGGIALCKVISAIALLSLFGCGDSGPTTFPVRGKIVFVRGGVVKRLYDRQGAIQFRSLSQPDVHAYGEINEDGTFTLTSTDGTDAWPGAVAGEHQGRLNLDDEIRDSVAPRFLDFEKSGIKINVPSDGEAVVRIWK